MKNSQRALSVVLALGLVCAFAGLSYAQTAPGGGACAADAEKLCAGVKPGNGAIKQCLKEHKDELSPACKDSIKQKAKARISERRAAKGDTSAAPSGN